MLKYYNKNDIDKMAKTPEEAEENSEKDNKKLRPDGGPMTRAKQKN
jgi:hypothetical protein